MNWKIQPSKTLRGEVQAPPDKSISHRAIMFGSITKGDIEIRNFLSGEDCLSTLEAFRSMGIEIERSGDVVKVHGKGLKGLTAPDGPIYLGNSGTSMRIIPGILSGQSFRAELTGDESLSKRPMGRIVDPLTRMNAAVTTVNGDSPPIVIKGSGKPLTPISYTTPVASAQVKSCILAAGLYVDGTTRITEPFQSRDHTERMLEFLSADISRDGLTTNIRGMNELKPELITVPGDISSAAFFIVGALLLKGSDVIIRNVGLNPTRDGIIRVLRRMGADIEILDKKPGLEPVGDIRVKGSELEGTTIEPEEIPLLIDEIPILILAASRATGDTSIRDISELKLKETDRVKSMTDNLSKCGISMREDGKTLIVSGNPGKISAAVFESFGDHRIAMSMAIAALTSDEKSIINNVECVDTSYPQFIRNLQTLAH